MKLRKTIGLSLALLFASAPAMAKEADTRHHPSASHAKAKADNNDEEVAKKQAARRDRRGRTPAQAAARHHALIARQAAALPPPDQYIGPLRVIGKREIGHAAWYGGRHLGRRTASGERLDDIHVTAAHRSLPIHSLVRVTNLGNGRSVIATINDRGPVSRSLLIDMSPRAAEELRMVYSGIATVSIEPVAPASASAQQDDRQRR